ncbi:MAPK regulated corepressor interacting protein 2 isoform X2 [Denticeps clupeoides]|uniref:MAPK regulated corepressor interacting protein 2 isoform X2 n=1 Tax=Denticeps clupeoides TaxID=299321 RepID=UPI0010A575F4|nr:MAPK regulated corepressor interacting protein 2 isoform X2 [Denticeps clupeoides]
MMYTITRGPSKLVTQRRTGPTQQIDNKINGFKHKPASFSAAGSQAPKLVFNGLNRKKLHSPPQPAVHAQAEGFTAAHEENVRFVFEGAKPGRRSNSSWAGRGILVQDWDRCSTQRRSPTPS